MVGKVTACASKDGLRNAACSVDAPAVRARLRRISGGNFHEFAASPCHLVLQELDETTPPGLVDASSESPICFDHAANVQFLDDHTPVALGDGRREFVQEIITLPSDCSVQARNAEFGLLFVLRSFPSSGDDTLSMGKTDNGLLHPLRILDESAIAVGDEVDDASVERDGWQRARQWLCDFKNAGDHGEPLIPVPSDCAGLGRAFKRAVSYDAKRRAEFWEVQPTSIKTPDLRVRFTKVDRVASFALPSRLISEFLETTLPCKIKFDEELRTDVTGDIGEPREFGAKFGQLVHLVEGGEILPITSWVCKPEQALLVRQVPEEAQGIAPRIKPSDLLDRRVNAKAKCLASLHKVKYILVYEQVKRFSPRASCRLQPQRALGLCSQISAKSDLSSCVGNSTRSVRGGMPGFFVRSEGSGIRDGSCTSSNFLSSQSSHLGAGQFAQRRVIEDSSCRRVAGSQSETLWRTLLESKLLRCVMRGSTSRNRQAVCRTTTRRGFLSVLKGGVSASEN